MPLTEYLIGVKPLLTLLCFPLPLLKEEILGKGVGDRLPHNLPLQTGINAIF